MTETWARPKLYTIAWPDQGSSPGEPLERGPPGLTMRRFFSQLQALLRPLAEDVDGLRVAGAQGHDRSGTGQVAR